MLKLLHNKGFTIVEVLIVLLLVSIATVKVAEQYTKYLNKTKRAVDVQSAQMLAETILILEQNNSKQNLPSYKKSNELIVTLECGSSDVNIKPLGFNNEENKLFNELIGTVPECSLGEGWYWYIKYNKNKENTDTDTLYNIDNKVEIYLKTDVPITKTYKVYPDTEGYIKLKGEVTEP